MYEKYFTSLYKAIDYMMEAYKNLDINRNHTNYGSATAYAEVLRDMGHKVELRVYGKDEYLITDKITIDDKTFDFFHN